MGFASPDHGKRYAGEDCSGKPEQEPAAVSGLGQIDLNQDGDRGGFRFIAAHDAALMLSPLLGIGGLDVHNHFKLVILQGVRMIRIVFADFPVRKRVISPRVGPRVIRSGDDHAAQRLGERGVGKSKMTIIAGPVREHAVFRAGGQLGERGIVDNVRVTVGIGGNRDGVERLGAGFVLKEAAAVRTGIMSETTGGRACGGNCAVELGVLVIELFDDDVCGFIQALSV